MTIVSLCRDCCYRLFHGCIRIFPCLADPRRRYSLGLRAVLVVMHIVFAGVLFLIDRDLIEKTERQPWYTGLYAALYITALILYFFTAVSSPGYVLDAIRAFNDKNTFLITSPAISKQPASSSNGTLGNSQSEASGQSVSDINGNVIVTFEHSQSERSDSGSNMQSWANLVLEMYPAGTTVRSLMCSYCNIVQPPRAKHCHDCDKCVVQFDHHCFWLGTCIGHGNHCRFWWYIFLETALCIWTGLLYMSYLRHNISKAWWKDAIIIILLIFLWLFFIFLFLLLLFHSYLILTNQTTYELVRRRRIPYLRTIPERVFPFSKGVIRNVYHVCCAPSSVDDLDRLPTYLELEEKARPYTCLDFWTCRCCL